MVLSIGFLGCKIRIVKIMITFCKIVAGLKQSPAVNSEYSACHSVGYTSSSHSAPLILCLLIHTMRILITSSLKDFIMIR